MEKKHVIKLTVALTVVAIFVVAVAVLVVHRIISSGIMAGPDKRFGNQNLVTAVALIELHKVRYGEYPQDLNELKFVGEWDFFALNSVRYNSNHDHTAYFIEVTRGFVGKPELQIPAEFWQGTGYDPLLKRTDE